MTLRRTDSKNVMSNEISTLQFDSGRERLPPADNRQSMVVEAQPEARDVSDPQLRFDFGDNDAYDVEKQESVYESLATGELPYDGDDRVIMVVDDDHAIREALKDLLGVLGFRVVSARDGEDALTMLRDGCKPFAILLDLGMPRMDGWRFRTELLSDPEYSELRVIVITASEGQQPEALGVSDVLTKPVPLRRLVEVLGNQNCEI